MVGFAAVSLGTMIERVNLVLSPHFDDAVLSAGAWLSRHPGAIVATIFSGEPGVGVPASEVWDVHAGFQSGNEAVRSRRSEDQRALALLGAEQRIVGFLDEPYRTSSKIHEQSRLHQGEVVAAVSEAIQSLLDELRPEKCLFPLGSGQGDHGIASDAAINALNQSKTLMIAYTDLPYAVMNQDFPPTRIQELQNRGLTVGNYDAESGDIGSKLRAWQCYESQLKLVGTDGCFRQDSERFYRIDH